MTQHPQFAIAMDWGGTWARAAVIDRQGDIHWQSRTPNASGAGSERLLADAQSLLQEAISWCGNRQLAGVGIAVAGPVDAETGTLHEPPNLRPLDGVSLKALWQPLLGFQVWVGNDANLAALGEFYHGAGLDAAQAGASPKTLVFVTVSTGIGGGVVNRGEIFLGSQGLAGEVGHMSIDWSATAPQCQCGNKGCLEILASGTAIAAAARDRLAGGQWPGSIMAAGAGDDMTSESVFEAATLGDALALGILEEVVQALAVGLGNVLHLYNPDLLVLGGGVTSGFVQMGLLSRIESLTRDRAMTRQHNDFRLLPAKLGDAAGLVGAATQVWQGVEPAA
jgi:glucokinase